MQTGLKISRLKAFLIHSFLYFATSLTLYFFLTIFWYPWPFGALVKFPSLVIWSWLICFFCGPVITAIFWNKKKTGKEISSDILSIGLIQVAAILFCGHLFFSFRPVLVVFEVDRFRVVTAAEINSNELMDAVPSLRNLSWSGPNFIGTRGPKDTEEKIRSIELSLMGKEPSLRPGWWQDINLNKKLIIERARSVNQLEVINFENLDIKKKINDIEGEYGKRIAWLPLTSAFSDDWVIFFRIGSVDPIFYLNVSGFK